MSFLTDSNYFSDAIPMINGKSKLSSTQKQKRKFLYLEGLIRFLELYANNEIGNVTVNIEKCSLYVNSPEFENIDLYNITNIESVYKMLEQDLLNNIPLYRFLNLSNYQMKIFEKEHYDILLESYNKDCDKYPCLKCIWYVNKITPFGTLSECKLPKEEITHKMLFRRQKYHSISRHTRCKYVTTLDNKQDFINKYIIGNVYHHYERTILNNIEHYSKKLKDKINTLDNSIIPPYIPDDDKIDLASNIDILEDMGRAFNNKLTKSDIQNNLREAIFLECMIKFVEIYAQSELGSNYYANIAKIAKWVENNISKINFKCKDDAYKYIENQIIDGMDMTKFCKNKEVDF